MTLQKGQEVPTPASVLHLWAGSKVPNTHTLSSQPHRGPRPCSQTVAPEGRRGPGSPWPGSESPEATTMKSRRLFGAACSLGTILLSHKCFKFLSFCLQGFWQPQAEGECSGTDTDSPWLGKVRPGQPEEPADQLLLQKSPEMGTALIPPPPLPHPQPRKLPDPSQHDLFWGPITSLCGHRASTLLPSRMSLKGRPSLRAPGQGVEAAPAAASQFSFSPC